MHQVWSLDLPDQRLQPLAGTGREGLLDGMVSEAWFAQPSGLTLAAGKLYVADSEVSAIREIDLASGCVRTLVGEDLFVFGDQDGEGEVVRLQHPLGISAGNGALYLADSYNNKIKRLNPETRQVTTWLGSGPAREGQGMGPVASLREPGGLCATDSGLYIADTNNHRIAFADWRTGRLRTVIGAGATAQHQK
jgi:DNA-binding beta-propeller fold protein YncE